MNGDAKGLTGHTTNVQNNVFSYGVALELATGTARVPAGKNLPKGTIYPQWPAQFSTFSWAGWYYLMYAALLANVARYLTLTPSEQAYVTSLFVAAHVPRFGYVLQAGQPTRTLTFVTRGCLRTYATDGQGKETVLSFA